MVCICDIKSLINSIINQRKMYMQFDTDEQRCKNYEETKKKLEEAHRLEEQYWKELAEKINEYIDYPKSRWAIFDMTDKAKIGYSYFLSERYIRVPYIEKKEYYCVINLLKKNDNFWKSDDKFLLYIEEE